MATTKTAPTKTPAMKKPAAPKPAAKKPAAKKVAAKASTSRTKKVGSRSAPIRTAMDEMAVQADLATMDARDQLNKMMSNIDGRRAAVETAMRRLAKGGADATQTMNEAVREAMVELRRAVEDALAALR